MNERFRELFHLSLRLPENVDELSTTSRLLFVYYNYIYSFYLIKRIITLIDEKKV